MKVQYYPNTDSLYLDLAERVAVDSLEVSDGVVLDYDDNGNVVGIDIDNASQKIALQRLIVSHLPGAVETVG